MDTQSKQQRARVRREGKKWRVQGMRDDRIVVNLTTMTESVADEIARKWAGGATQGEIAHFIHGRPDIK